MAFNKKGNFQTQKSASSSASETSSDPGSPVMQRKEIKDKPLNEAVKFLSAYLDNGNQMRINWINFILALAKEFKRDIEY